MGNTVSDIRQQLDPCKQYMQHAWEHLVIAMGQLPKCIDLNSPVSLISQVVMACSIPDPNNHTFLSPMDNDGTWEAPFPQGTQHAIGVYSRLVGGDYQAIYFYTDGTIIVIDKWNNYKFHMDG